MRKSLFNILQGVGSLFDIMPSQKKADYGKYILRASKMDIMGYAFAKAGKDIREAIGEYSDDQKPKEISCPRHKSGCCHPFSAR